MIALNRTKALRSQDEKRVREAADELPLSFPRMPNQGMTHEEFVRHLQRTRNEDLDPLYQKVWSLAKSMD